MAEGKPYTPIDIVSHSPSGVNGYNVVCCGECVAAEVGAVQDLLTRKEVPLADQISEWNSLIDQVNSPLWARLCMERMEQVADLLDSRAAFLRRVGYASGSAAATATLSPLTDRHFQWLGPHSDLVRQHLVEGIMRLATEGAVLSADADQQSALRRALGYTVNDTERTTLAPRVIWLASENMVHYLISSLWNLGLIGCSGGARQKWNTARQVFALPGLKPLGSSLKSNPCLDPAKQAIIEKCLVGGLRHIAK